MRRLPTIKRVDLMFVIGVGLLIQQAVFASFENSSLIFAAVALMGLPLVARGNDKVNGAEK